MGAMTACGCWRGSRKSGGKPPHSKAGRDGGVKRGAYRMNRRYVEKAAGLRGLRPALQGTLR